MNSQKSTENANESANMDDLEEKMDLDFELDSDKDEETESTNIPKQATERSTPEISKSIF